MSDQRRVCDLSPLELFEAALAACAPFGWTRGHWALELHAEDGHVRRALPRLVDASPSRIAVGRRQLEHRDEGELGSAA